MATTTLNVTALSEGKTVTVLNETVTSPGTSSAKFAIESETILISVYASAISGTLDIKVYTQAGEDDSMDLEIISFPTLSAPTTDLILKKAALAMQYIRVEATYTGAATFVIKAKAINTGEASVRLLGQNDARNYATTVTTSVAPLIPAAMTDRVGIALHNKDAVKTVYMGFTIANTTVADGWEIGPGEKLGLDVASGVAIYAVVTSGTSIVKVIEAGS